MRSILFLAWNEMKQNKSPKQTKREKTSGKNLRCPNVTQNSVEREKYVKQFAVCWKVIATQTKIHDKVSRLLNKLLCSTEEKKNTHFFLFEWAKMLSLLSNETLSVWSNSRNREIKSRAETSRKKCYGNGST